MNTCRFLSLAAGIAALLPVAAHAVAAVQGDMLMGFRVPGGSQTYLVNIGQAGSFRDATGPITITNINSNLSALFGPDWATRGDLLWGVAAAPSRNVAFNGDPTATLYLSQSQTIEGTADTPFEVPSLTQRKLVAADYAAVLGVSGTTPTGGGFLGSSSNVSNPKATSQANTFAGSWSSYMSSDTVPLDLEAGEIEGTPVQTLSLFRFDTNAAGTYLGYFKIQEDGSVVYTPAPSSVTYGSWAATNVGGDAANLDKDNDGISNGVEFFTGSNPTSFTSAPVVTDGHIVWPRASGRSVTTVVVQTSSNLVNWTDATANLASGVGSIDFTVPTGQPKLFVRLKVTP
ncbi:MAG: hypothetical protein QM755_23580 [Luteolibacter sp.]